MATVPELASILTEVSSPQGISLTDDLAGVIANMQRQNSRIQNLLGINEAASSVVIEALKDAVEDKYPLTKQTLLDLLQERVNPAELETISNHLQ